MENISDIAATNSRISSRAVRRKFRLTRAEMRTAAEDLGARIHKRIDALRATYPLAASHVRSEMRAIALDVAGIMALAIDIDSTRLQSLNLHRAWLSKRITKICDSQKYWQRRFWLGELDFDINEFVGWAHYIEDDAT